MPRYTHKDDKNINNWMFHVDYFTDKTRFLPKSIQNELAKRLTGCARNPLSQDQLKDINPVIEVKLQNICESYRNKQKRSRRASAKKRAPKQAEEESESESESESEDEDKHAEFHKFMSEFRTRMRIQNR